MNNYQALKEYAVQLTGDPTEVRNIIEQTIEAAIELKISKEAVVAFMRVTIRNKCYDYSRNQGDPETQAAALGVSVGNVQQAIRAIREGRWMDS